MTEPLLAAELDTFLKGVGVTITSILIFFGSVYVLLAAVFGRWMGYLVTAVTFWGMMIIFSLIFVFGVPGSTPPNLGPRGTRYACPTCISEPHWAPVAASEDISSRRFESVAQYPGGPWKEPDAETRGEIEAFTTAAQDFMVSQVTGEAEAGEGEAEEGQGEEEQQQPGAGEAVPGEGEEEGGLPPTEGGAEIGATDFVVQNIRFHQEGDVELAAAQVFYRAGGPVLEVFAVFDEGDVPLPSFIFLGVSVLAFAAHLPFLDRAERRRKDILTGGDAPKFLGPA